MLLWQDNLLGALPVTQRLYSLRISGQFPQVKQSLVEGAEEQGVPLKQILLNTDLRKVSCLCFTSASRHCKTITYMHQISCTRYHAPDIMRGNPKCL